VCSLAPVFATRVRQCELRPLLLLLLQLCSRSLGARSSGSSRMVMKFTRSVRWQ
jgi:hypothetical protein